jgi:hypothetical protein
MSKCVRCGCDSYAAKVCTACMSSWSKMRTELFDYLQKKHGEMCGNNLMLIQNETKRLEKTWRKDKEKFYKEISL